MNIFKHLITVMLLTATVVAQASGSGVYRTAITLTNGTQEIFPDTLVKEFRYSHTVVDDRIVYSLNVMKDGHVVMSIPVDSIVEVNYREMTPYEHFAGDWYLVASPNGEPLPGTSIMVSTAVSIPYHAVLPAPGTPGYGRDIYCHIDSMAHRKGLKCEADFKMRYSWNESAQSGTITMVLDDQHPVSDEHYPGDASTYAVDNLSVCGCHHEFGSDARLTDLTGLFLFLAYATQTVGCDYTTAGKNAFLTTFYVIMIPLLTWRRISRGSLPAVSARRKRKLSSPATALVSPSVCWQIPAVLIQA